MFVHEMGIYVAAGSAACRWAPTFIPFVGAWIEMAQMPHDAETDMGSGLGGPLVGTLGAGLLLRRPPTWATGPMAAGGGLRGFSQFVQPDPISPLDGGRSVVAPHLAAGRAHLAGLVLVAPSPMLIIAGHHGGPAGSGRRGAALMTAGGLLPRVRQTCPELCDCLMWV